MSDMNEDLLGNCRVCGQMISRNLAADVYGLSRGVSSLWRNETPLDRRRWEKKKGARRKRGTNI